MAWKEHYLRRLPTLAEIRENKVEIEELDRKIVSLTAQIDELNLARDSLLKERDAKASFISAFRRLPPEILCQIAWYSMMDSHTFDRPKLSQVNSSMRQAVNGMKLLWNKIYIDGKKASGGIYSAHSTNDTRVWCRNTNYLRLVLERSAPAMLDIIINTDNTDSKQWKILFPVFERIKILRLEGIRDFRKLPLGGPPSLQAPYLEHLSLGRFSEYSVDVVKYFLDLAMTSRSDRMRLTLSCSLGIGSGAVRNHQIFSQIEVLELNDDFDRDSLIPSQCPKLRTLSLDDAFFETIERLDTSNIDSLCLRGGLLDSFPQQLRTLNLHNMHLIEQDSISDPILLPSVTCVTLSCVTFESPLSCLFELPNLEELVLHMSTNNLPEEYNLHPDSEVYSSILNTIGNLKSLKRLWMEGMDHGWSWNFNYLPNIETLKLVDCKLDDNEEYFLRLFKDQSYLEHLKEVLIQNCVTTEFSLEKVRPIMEKHRPAVRLYGDECSDTV